MPDEWVELLQDDDDADAAHKSAQHGVGDIAHVFAEFYQTEQYLEHPAEDARQGHAYQHGGEAAAACGESAAHEGGGDDCHRACGAADLAVCAAEECGEETEQGGADQSGVGSHRGCVGVGYAAECLYAECQGQWQCHDAGSDASEEVAFEVFGSDQ